MTSNSQNLSLPYVQEGQAQKHITHNEALRMLDALVQLAVENMPQDTPPASPATGARFIVGPAPTGDWVGHASQVALYDGSWLFFDPVEGWRAEVLSTGASVVFRGGAWEDTTNLDFENLDGVGIMTSHDATNRLAVQSDATLLTHAGAGHQLKLNKSTLADTASLVFQTNWSGRAEMGLVGDDSFQIKVSEDGSDWVTGIEIEPKKGGLRVPNLMSGEIAVDSDAVGFIPTPKSGGLVSLLLTHDLYPRSTHSAIFAYSTGLSLHLESLALGRHVNNLGSAALTGSTGSINRTSVGVMAGGLRVENRNGASRTYSYTFIC